MDERERRALHRASRDSTQHACATGDARRGTGRIPQDQALPEQCRPRGASDGAVRSGAAGLYHVEKTVEAHSGPNGVRARVDVPLGPAAVRTTRANDLSERLKQR